MLLISSIFTMPVHAQNDTPILQAPDNGATNVGLYPNLLWESQTRDVASPVQMYQAQIATDAAFKNVIVNDQVEIARFVPANARLKQAQTYYWRVRCVQGTQAGVWSEIRTFSTADYSGADDSRVFLIHASDTVDQVREIFEKANTVAPATIRLAEDVRWGDDSRTDLFNLQNMHDIRFDGNGKAITITTPHNRVFHVLSCDNMLFENFTVDFDPLPYGIVQIVKKDAQTNELTVTAITDGDAGMQLNDPRMIKSETHHLRLLDKKHPGRILYGKETYIHDTKHTFDPTRSYQLDGKWYHILQINPRFYTTDYFEVGQYLLRTARNNATNTLRAARSSGICVNNVISYASSSQFVGHTDGTGFVLIHSGVALKPGRYCSVTADCVYDRRNAVGAWIENCQFVAGGDDCMNLHSFGTRIDAKIDEHTLKVEPSIFHEARRMDVGDQVAIWDGMPGDLAPVYTTVIAKDASKKQIRFADPVGQINLDDKRHGTHSLIYNVSKANPRFYIKNNLIKDGARFGVLLSSIDGAIVGNTFDHCEMSAIKIGNNPGEGHYTRNVLIKDNHMLNCGYAKATFEKEQGVINIASYGTYWTETPHHFHSNIRIVDNLIAGWECAAFRITGCSDVLITGTRLTDGGQKQFSPLAQRNQVFILRDADRITVKNTVMQDQRGNITTIRDMGNTHEIYIEATGNSSNP
jgi:hypothetical protein